MNKSFPAFSVLITVYYKEKPQYLDNALKSIEEQTVKPNEVILVEDGELGNDLNKVVSKHNRLKNPNFKVVKLKENMGRGYASQVGLEHASNEWIARMDSDDISVKNRFELQLSAIMKDRNVKVVGGQINEFEYNVNNKKGSRHVPLTFEGIKEYAKYRSPVNNPTVMFSKSAVNEVGGFTSIDVMEDYDLWVRLIANNYMIINLKNVLVNMRVGEDMYSRRGGFLYLLQYIKMKNKWRKMGTGNIITSLVSDLSMMFNVLLPTNIRRIMYQKLLHKK